MKRAISKFAVIFLIYLIFFALQRLLFLGVYQHTIHAGAGEWFGALWHGLAMDASVAGYLSVLPGIIIAISCWVQNKWIGISEKIYFGIVSFILSFVTILDLTLYGYWGFRLDTTPFFYFSTSPSAAMASAEWWQIPVGCVAMAAIGFALYKILTLTVKRYGAPYSRPKTTCAIIILLTGLLFIPIRGGVTVSTMNLSRAYFSDNARLNHAAINPQFSLLSSLFQQRDFSKIYRFMSEADARRLLADMNRRENGLNQESNQNGDIEVVEPILNTGRPDVYIIILESFSSHLFKSLGGEDIASGLDSIARTGILFTNISASSFRTDRSLPAILSGFPAQPSMSIMKYVDKMESLPSISHQLNDVGYTSSYYYGGDINFTNMKSYLVHSGFGSITADTDFPVSQRLGKWGAPDHVLFEKALADIRSVHSPSARTAGEVHSPGARTSPRFTVIQTSSSHEPFDVPYTSSRFSDNKRLNAFEYTDREVTKFINEVNKMAGSENSLFILIPDHYGVYPENLESMPERHRVPLILAGGALSRRGLRIDAVGSQTDIAATLLSMLGIDDSKFEFSHNLLQPGRKGYSFFSEKGLAGLITATDTVIYDPDAEKEIVMKGKNANKSLLELKAYLQQLYTRISEM